MKPTLKETYFSGANFRTPYIIGYRYIKNKYKVELSHGRGFTDNKIYGVTVRTVEEVRYDLSKCLHSMKEVEEYLVELEKL